MSSVELPRVEPPTEWSHQPSSPPPSHGGARAPREEPSRVRNPATAPRNPATLLKSRFSRAISARSNRVALAPPLQLSRHNHPTFSGTTTVPSCRVDHCPPALHASLLHVTTLPCPRLAAAEDEGQTRVVPDGMLVVHPIPAANHPWCCCLPRMWLLLPTAPTCLLSPAAAVEAYATYCVRMKLLLLP